MGSPEPISPKESLASLESKLHNLDANLHLVDNEIWALRDKMPKHSRLRFGKKSQPSETNVGKLAEFKKQFEELKLEAEEVSNQITEIRLQEYEKENAMLLIPELIVIAFVNELEKADQYFDFKDYLSRQNNITEDSNAIDVVNELLKEENREKFDKLDENIIRRAVVADILQKKVDRAPAKYIEYFKVLNSDKWEWERCNVILNMSKPTEVYHNEKDGSLPVLNVGLEEIDGYVFTHPICYLVFLTRQQDNVMNQDPKEELKKIKEFDSGFFDCYVQYRLPREEFEKIMSTYKDTSREEALVRVRTELYKKALEKYSTITKKLMPDSNWKRSSPSDNVGEFDQSVLVLEYNPVDQSVLVLETQ